MGDQVPSKDQLNLWRLRVERYGGMQLTKPESLALFDEIERLTQCLATANANHERFEREWYLRGDEIDRLSARNERLERELAQLGNQIVKGALKPAHEREPPHCSTCGCPPYSGWRPIETAPVTDRENPVYVAYPHYKPENNTKTPDFYSCFTAYKDNLGWDSGFWRLHEEPHFWHPLPAAPTPPPGDGQ